MAQKLRAIHRNRNPSGEIDAPHGIKEVSAMQGLPETTAPAVRYEFLDALRGFAILGVLSLHCASMTGRPFWGIDYAKAGSQGVQLFFVISAFTIFLTLDRAMGRERHVFKNFFVRRFFRILPMFWLGAAFYAFAPGREVYEHPFDLGVSEYFLTAVLQHGWSPFSLNSVVPGGWTIAIEATFYLIGPVLFLLVRDWQRAVIFLLVTLFLCAGANRVLDAAIEHRWIFSEADAQLMAFFRGRWFPSQLPVFACGVLAYRIWQALPPGFASRLNGLVLLACAALVLNACVSSGGLTFIPEPACFALGFLLLLLALSLYSFAPMVNAATQFLGRISYSFYLLHFVMLCVGKYLADALNPPSAGATFLVTFAFVFLLTLPCACLAARFIERPFIKLGSALIRRMERPPAVTPGLAVPAE